jgi:hypothetical protein
MKAKNSNILISLLLLSGTIILFLILSELLFRVITYAPHDSWIRRHDLEEYNRLWSSYYGRADIINHPFSKSDETFRIAAVGDSFTQGGSYEDGADMFKRSYPVYLEQMLNSNFNDMRYEVLNFGFSSVTPLEEFYILRDHVLDYDPNLVLLGVTDNDDSFFIYNLDPFIYCDLNFSKEELRLYWLNEHWKLFSYIYTGINSRVKRHYVNAIGLGHPVSDRCFSNSVARIKDLLDKEGIPLAVIFINDFMHEEGRTYFRDYISRPGYSMTDYEGVFDAFGLDVAFAKDYMIDEKMADIYADDLYHYNHKGNEMIALAAYNHILEKGLLPSCSYEDCMKKRMILNDKKN